MLDKNALSTDNIEIIHIGKEVSYNDVLAMQEQAVADILAGTSGEKIFLCEHSHIYTCGSSSNLERDLLNPKTEVPVVKSGRGGQITYHGNGQLVIYPIIDLRKRGKDLRKYVNLLQQAIIDTLEILEISAHGDKDNVGVWVSSTNGKENKIAAIGVRVRKWITFHGVALNINPDLSYYDAITPCGISDKNKGITSLAQLGNQATMKEVKDIFTEVIVNQL